MHNLGESQKHYTRQDKQDKKKSSLLFQVFEVLKLINDD